MVGESGGAVFRLRDADGDDLYLKFGTGAVAEAIADEAVRLRWLATRLPCPETRAFVAQRGAAWLLTTALPGKTGDAWLEHDPAMLPQIITAFAAFLRRLHALPMAECPFDSGRTLRLAAARRNVAAGLVDVDDFDDDHAGWSAAEMLAETERLAEFAPQRVVTHGDFSLGNLLLTEDCQVTGVIDLDRLGTADPYQDIAIFWQNMADFGGAAQAQFLAEMGIERVDAQRLAFHRCLDELF